MKNFLLLMFVNLLFACKISESTKSLERNERFFKKSLEIISGYEDDKKGTLVNTYNDATLYLSLTTGIVSKANYSNTIGYATREEYLEDIKKWKDWYTANRQKLTDSYIDSAYNSLKLAPPSR